MKIEKMGKTLDDVILGDLQLSLEPLPPVERPNEFNLEGSPKPMPKKREKYNIRCKFTIGTDNIKSSKSPKQSQKLENREPVSPMMLGLAPQNLGIPITSSSSPKQIFKVFKS